MDASLVLAIKTRADGHKQGYWTKDGSGGEGGDAPTEREQRAAKAEKLTPQQEGVKQQKVHTKAILDGTATPPDVPPAVPGVDPPPKVDLATSKAKEAAAQAQKEKWEWKGQLHPKLQEALVSMAQELKSAMAQNPGKETLLGVGALHVQAGECGAGALGVFEPRKGDGLIKIAPQCAKRIQACLVKGEVTTHEDLSAFEVFSHEAGHSISRMHIYEGINGGKDKHGGKPHAMMEEATTEIFGQTHAEAVVKGFGLKLALKDSGPFGLKSGMDKPMAEFDPATQMPKLNIPVAYHPIVRNVVAMAMVAEGTKNAEDVHNAAVNWGNTLKRTRGGLRYERLADRMLERNGLKRDADDDLYKGAVEYAVHQGGALPVKDPAPFTAARQELAEHLRFLVGTNKAIRVPELAAHAAMVAKKYGAQ
jgi:hypothetical protein